MKNIILLAGFFFCLYSYAQVTIDFRVSPLVETSDAIYLIADNQTFQRPKNSSNTYNFIIDASFSPGVYRILYNSKNANTDYVDVIVTHKDSFILVDLEIQNNQRSVSIHNSEENAYYQSVQKQQSIILNKLKLLNQYHKLNNEIPKDKREEKFLKQIEKQYANLSESFQNKRTSVLQNSKYHWAKMLVAYSPLFIPKINENIEESLDDYYANYWERIPPIIPELFKTMLPRELIQNYFKYYLFHPEYIHNIEKLKAITFKSLDKFSTSETAKQFAIQEIQEGLKSLDFTTLLQYVDEKYAADQCDMNEGTNIELQNRLRSYEVLKTGAPAPEIDLNDESIHNLKDITQSYVVIVFHSLECSHCLNQVPQLYSMLKDVEQIKMVSILLSDSRDDVDKAMVEYPNMLHYSDLQGWGGKVADDYFIRGTPTYFLLDKDKAILGSFKNINSLVEYLSQIL